MQHLHSLKTSTLLISLLTLLSSCGSSKLEYTNGVDFPKTITAKSEILISSEDLMLVYPQQMAVLDSLLIIKDLASNDNYFSIYSLSGEPLATFGRKGKGPGELLQPQNFTMDYKNKVLMVKDRFNNLIFYYDIYAILNGERKYYQTYEVIDNLSALHIIPLYGERYLNIEMSDESRFRLFDKDQDLYNYNKVPEFLVDDLHNVDFLLSRGMSNQAIKPDGTKFVNGGEIGAVLEVFSIKGDVIKEHETLPIYKPLYDIKNGIPLQNLETRRGFSTMAASDDYIYTVLYHSKKSEERVEVKDISVFNWDAKPKFLIKTDHTILSLCSNDDDTIYAACLDEDGNMFISKLTL
ncbi:MAG: BF3164 family lipoprotein [Rikenellaceae bacterium]